MTHRKDAYFRRVSRTLGACQFVEFELKIYISEALELTAKCVAGRLPFKMAGSDYEGASLERLIEVFKKLSDCPALVKRMKKFKEERNFIAHRAITTCIDPDGELDHGESRKLVSRLANTEKEAIALAKAIHAKVLRFRAHLDFWDINRASVSRGTKGNR